MRIRVKEPKRVIVSAVLLFMVILVFSKLAVNGESVPKENGTKVVSKETFAESGIQGRLIEVDSEGNIFLEENTHFKKYSIQLNKKDDYVDYEQNEAYIYVQLANPKEQKLSEKSFSERSQDVFLATDNGQDVLVIKKNFEYNNFVFYNELKDTLIVLVSKEKEPYKYSIVLDPGHGGVDPGAEAYDKSFWEKDVTLKLTKEIRPELIYNGCEVALSREEDTTIKLEDIVSFTNERRPDAFISVHINAYDKSSKYNGLSVYYSKDNAVPQESESLADFIQKNIIAEDGWKDREVRAENFYVVKHSDMPAVLIECGFATNPEDVARLNDDSVLYNLSKNISRGIIEYLEEK